MKLKLVLCLFIFAQTFARAAPLNAKLALNWKPEPEFGGFYEAMYKKYYEAEGLHIEILPGGAGQPVVQMVAGNQATFGIAAGDEVILGRNNGANLVAVYAVYQNDPQGFMVHKEKKFKSLKEVFQSDGTIALQKGLPYTLWLQKKYAPVKANLVPYTGGVTTFIRDQNFSQQCFIFSEPLAAKKEKMDPQTFMISDSGFNPYLTVVVVDEKTMNTNPDLVKKFVSATQKGWRSYLKDPTATNTEMQKLNPSMDLATFNEAAKAQQIFIENRDTDLGGLGTMSRDRWTLLYRQLVELNLVKSGLDVTHFFKNK
jgi:NitT/TauT family transport system substrate-binding protein